MTKPQWTHNTHFILHIISIWMVFFLCTSMSAIQVQKSSRINIVDEKGNSIPGASVSVINKRDSTIIYTTISDKDGVAEIKHILPDSMGLIVRCLGYKPSVQPFYSTIRNVSLAIDPHSLSEVSVTVSPNSIKHKDGRFIFSPGSLKNEVQNSYELLKLTPLLDINETAISIIGKGASIIYINGRDPQTDNNSLIGMLKSLPPGQIKRIEIITNPGSEHSASLKGGIINIILDKPTEGFIGSTFASVKYYGGRISTSDSFWGGFSKGKINLSTNITYNGNNIYSKTQSDYSYEDKGLQVIDRIRESGWGNLISGNVNASYSYSHDTQIGITINATGNQSHSEASVNSLYTEQNNLKSTDSKIKSSSPWHRPNYSVQAYYNHKTDSKGSYIDVTADYSSKYAESSTKYLFNNGIQLQSAKTESNGFHIKPRLFLQINSLNNISTGLDVLHSRIDNDFIDEQNGNRFIYKETIVGGCADWNARWNDLISTSCGLRVEKTHTEGKMQKDIVKHGYTDFFPSVNINFNIPKGNQGVSLGVSHGIFRPFYSSLNPFVYWTSETTCIKGNPDLKPERDWRFSIYYSFLSDFIFGSTFTLTSDSYIDFTYPENDITVTSTRNFGHQKSFTSFISYNHVFGSIWRLKGNAQFYFYDSEAFIDNMDLGYRDTGYSFNISNNIILSPRHKLRLYVDYSYYSPVKMVTRYGKSKNLLSLSLSKGFRNGMTLSLEGFNLLGFKNDYHYNSPQYRYSKHSDFNPISITFKINYVFGKRQVSGAENRYDTPFETRFKN